MGVMGLSCYELLARSVETDWAAGDGGEEEGERDFDKRLDTNTPHDTQTAVIHLADWTDSHFRFRRQFKLSQSHHWQGHLYPCYELYFAPKKM